MRSRVRTALVLAVLLAAGSVDAQRGQPTQEPAVIRSLAPFELDILEDRLAFYSTYPNELANHAAELKILADAADASGPGTAYLRYVAFRAMGRLQFAAFIPTLILHLSDADSAVRRDAASALGQALHNANQDAVPAVRAALLSRVSTEQEKFALGDELESLGGLPAGDAGSQIADVLVDAVVAQSSRPHDPGDIARSSGAARGLEALTRQTPTPPVSEASRIKLRQAIASGLNNSSSGPGMSAWFPALEALHNAHDVDVATIVKAAGYQCVTATDAACGWQVRRIATLMIDPAKPDFETTLASALHDPAYQVRFEALRPWVRGHLTTRSCQALVDALTDEAPHVVMKAMDPQIMRPSCLEHDLIVDRLTQMASALGSARAADRWQVPSRALGTLAAFAPKDAARLLPGALTHEIWQVRAAAAEVAATVGDADAALQLAHDAEPNVQTEAIKALEKLRSDKLTDVALGVLVDASRTLAKRDYQLVLTAAEALTAVPAPKRDEAASDLLDVLDRVTADGKDTSRDPRLAIIKRLDALQTASPLVVARLSKYTTDFDPAIAEAAAALVQKLTGTPTIAAPKMPVLAEPSAIELWQMRDPRLLISIPRLGTPRCCAMATITMTNGDQIQLDLWPSVAPITVWRFMTLARQQYYDNRTFHRVVTNFVIQGGSPGANEYMGDTHFARDEIGMSNVRGAVGLSTRGPHTGDMQMFIDLADTPRLDHDYTVFATVANLKDEDVIDRILEGATIRTVTVR